MRKIKGHNRDQALLFGSSISEALPTNHEIFAFAKFLDTLDMSGFERKYSHRGGKIYDPRMMLGLILYGYQRGIRSSRRLSRACVELLPMRYLTGGLHVKFRAIADFRVRFKEEIEEIFEQVVKAVVERVPEIGKQVNVDGTKIKAYASDAQSYRKSKLKEEQKKLRREIQDYLQGGIEEDRKEDRLYGDKEGPETDLESGRKLLAEVSRLQRERARRKFEQEERELIEKKLSPKSEMDSKETDDEKGSSENPLHLKNPNSQKTKQSLQATSEFCDSESSKPSEGEDVPSAKDEEAEEDASPSGEEADIILEKAIRLHKIERALVACAKEPDNSKINLTDPDSRFMKNRGKLTNSYNMQAASSKGFLVHIDVANTNSCNDLHELPSVLQGVKGNLGFHPNDVAADSGYFHDISLQYLQEHSIEGFIPNPQAVSKERKGEEETGFESYNFPYDSEKDALICPEGKLLRQNDSPAGKKRNNNSSSLKERPYHAQAVDCVPCPSRDACLISKQERKLGHRSVAATPSRNLKYEMVRKMKTEEGRRRYGARSSEIEPCFGIIKAVLDFWKTSLRGLEKFRVEAKLVGAAFNIKKLIQLGYI